MTDTPAFDVQVVGPDDYTLMILVDNDGVASMRSNGAAPEPVGDLLATLTGAFHRNKNLPMLITDDLAVLLTGAGWVPPFDPAAAQLDEHDWMELVKFAGRVESEGFGYAAEEYQPRFKNEALAAAIGRAPMDRLKALLKDRREAVDRFWERPDAADLLDAHEAAQRADRT